MIVISMVKGRPTFSSALSIGQAFTLVGAALLINAGHVKAVTVQNGFTGYYAPINWTLTNVNGAQGSVDTSSAPVSIVISGSDSGPEELVYTDYTIAAAATGEIRFSWLFEDFDTDSPPSYESFGYLNDGTYTQLSDGISTGGGSATVNVIQNNSFGFRVLSFDNRRGAGVATISNFSAVIPGPAEQVPAPLPLLALPAVFLWTRRLRRRVAAQPTTSPYRLG